MTTTVSCRGKELVLACDWNIGIGGSVWSTGLELVEHLHEWAEFYDDLFRDKTIVELGSGTGLVGLAIAAAFQTKQVILTDNSEHLEMIRQNLVRNQHVLQSQTECCVLDWNCPQQFDTVAREHVDILVATDVVYHRSLYRPFIATLDALSNTKTVCLLGVTRTDTDRTFFEELQAAGFIYRKLPEERTPTAYRGANFGLFVVTRLAS